MWARSFISVVSLHPVFIGTCKVTCHPVLFIAAMHHLEDLLLGMLLLTRINICVKGFGALVIKHYIKLKNILFAIVMCMIFGWGGDCRELMLGWPKNLL